MKKIHTHFWGTLIFLGLLPTLAFSQYCIPTLNCTDGDEFLEFSLGDFTNTSGCEAGGYSDFTGLLGLELYGGYSHIISFTNGFQAQRISVWVDFDNSESFEDSELLLADFTGGNFEVTTEIFIPDTTPAGDYRLRIQTYYNSLSSLDPCASVTYGETEDYTLTILPDLPCSDFNGDISFGGASSEAVILHYSDVSLDIEFGLKDFSPVGVPSNGLTNQYEQAVISGLSEGTTYDFYVRKNCSATGEGVSFWTGPYDFITSCVGAEIPVLEYFDDILGPLRLPECWTERYYDNLTDYSSGFETGTDAFAGDWLLSFSDDGGKRLKNFGISQYEYSCLVTPIYSLLAGESYQLGFDFQTEDFFEPIPFPFEEGEELNVLVSIDYGENWTILETLAAGDGGDMQFLYYDVSNSRFAQIIRQKNNLL